MSSREIIKTDTGKVTLRSILIGAFFTALAAVMAHYSVNVVYGSYLAIDHMPVAAISLFFFLVIVFHILITLTKRSLGLSPAELLIVYVMTFMGCSVTTMGIGSFILPFLGAPHYFATPLNRWEELILPNLRSWLIPQNKEAVRQFFEGMPTGGSIPWMVWIKPLLCWLPFLLSLYVVMICIPIIMRKQWIDKERLNFPLAQLPLEMIKRDDSSKSYPFFTNKLMWIAFLIPFVISSINGLHEYFHVIGPVNLAWAVPTFRGTQSLAFRISFPVIGFLYLVNTKVGFSLWFFYLFYHVLSGWFNITGVSSPEALGPFGAKEPIINHISTGALLSFAVYGLWLARDHLKEVFQKTFRANSPIDDSKELLSYRSSTVATILGIIVMIIWLTAAGLPLLMSFLFVILALLIFLALTRVIIETGIPIIRSPGVAAPQLISSVGSSAIGPSGLAGLSFANMYAADIRTFAMCAAANSIRIVEGIKKRRRWIFAAMLLAVVVSLSVSVITDLRLGYTYGGVNLNKYYSVRAPSWAFNFARDRIVHPSAPNKLGWCLKIAGATVLAGLMFMRGRFLWWPLHPVGFVAGSTWLMSIIWFSILISWMLKTVILRYGGPKIYRQARPFFFGLILGQYVVAALWFVIDLITGTTGNVVFWI